jgi:2-polyprenyl-3-methyl-5-hydroxy-6-metoxy-1,4-benzoquinol methylase
MQNWTQGYVLDVSYDYNYFPELAPTNLVFNLLDSRYLAPPLERFTYCELGCGQGFTSNILAAIHPHCEFWAIDFNPVHIAEAQRLADAAQLRNIHFSDQSFSDFIAADTPPFDFITLHGVYSWVGDESRQNIVHLLRKKLKVGGVVYISYNALPGWSALIPLRELMWQSPGQTGDSTLQRVETGMAFAQKLEAMKARYFLENPTARAELKAMEEDSRNYLAHEYFNQSWRPFYHSEVAHDLADAKLTFAASGDIDDHFYDFKLTADQAQLLANTTDTTRRETLRDFIFNTRFRCDLFIKGPIRLSALEQVEQCRPLYFALISDLDDIEYDAELFGRPIQLDQRIYEPLIHALADRPRSLGELMGLPKLRSLDFAAILQALKLLISNDHVVATLSPEQAGDRASSVAHLNQALLKRARFGADTQLLVSPVTASGVDVSRPEQLFLLAHQRQVDPVQFVWNILQVQGERLIKAGHVLESADANQQELAQQVQQFQEFRLPLYKRLRLI